MLPDLPSPTLNSSEYFFIHSSGNIPNVPSPSCTNCCLFTRAFFTSSTVTFCSPNCISIFASNQSVLLLIKILVDGFAVLKRKFFSASNPNTGIFISFTASTNKKNQLLRNTSVPFNARTLPSTGRIKPECSDSIFLTNSFSISRFRCITSSLSATGIIIFSLSVLRTSYPR